ncbi:MAG TPA: glycosyl hydrolase family 18 protein [Tepidiformaceae bacterium]|nr:glycosyl hydrolase family 18 protein [Tepidiformaceae bacterium]
MIGGLVLGLVVLGFFVYRMFFTGGCSDLYCEADDEIAAPGGFEFATALYERTGEPPAEGSAVYLEVPLASEEGDNRSLAFFGYDSSTASWQALTAASEVADTTDVSGTLATTPQYIAVLRRLSKAGQVVAYLDAGATLHGDAAGRITILHTRDFTPLGDGNLAGIATTVTRDPSFEFVPSISANAANGLPVVTSLLGSGTQRSAHVRAIVATADAAQLDGVDIAYLDLPADQRASFTLFVIELAQALHGKGKILTLTLPAPAKSAQGYNEGAYDWAELAKHADLVQLLPYPDPGSFRLDVPGLFEYLTSRVDPARLVMTVTPLATEKAPDGTLRAMTIVEAMTIASRLQIDATALEVNNNYSVVGVNIDKAARRSGVSWSPETATVFFTYDDGGGRTVYIENVFSVGFKLEYIPRFELGGVAIQDASGNPYLGNIWPALIPFIETGTPSLAQPNPADLAPVWDKTGGTLDANTRGTARWTAPAQPGTYSIFLILSDGVALFQNELTVTVQPRQQPGTSSGG